MIVLDILALLFEIFVKLIVGISEALLKLWDVIAARKKGTRGI